MCKKTLPFWTRICTDHTDITRTRLQV